MNTSYIYIGGPRDETQSKDLFCDGYRVSTSHSTHDLIAMVHISLPEKYQVNERLLQAFATTTEE